MAGVMSEYLKPNQLVKKGTVLDSAYYGKFVMLEDSSSNYAAKVRMIKPRQPGDVVGTEARLCALVFGYATKIIAISGLSDLEKIAADWMTEGDRLEGSANCMDRRQADTLKLCAAELTQYILTH